jgi:hypothetical protein
MGKNVHLVGLSRVYVSRCTVMRMYSCNCFDLLTAGSLLHGGSNLSS